MPSTYTYTKHFIRLKTLNNKNYKFFFANFKRFDEYYKENIPTERFGHIEWKFDSEKDYDTIYLNILKSLAQYFQVKVMFRSLLDQYENPTIGFWFIGDSQRIQIMYHIWIYLYRNITWYGKYVVNRKHSNNVKSKNGPALLSAARVDFQQYLTNIAETIQNLLEEDLNYTIYLEKFILNSYKLTFKNYKVKEHHYDHAISNKFFHKRMLL